MVSGILQDVINFLEQIKYLLNKKLLGNIKCVIEMPCRFAPRNDQTRHRLRRIKDLRT